MNVVRVLHMIKCTDVTVALTKGIHIVVQCRIRSSYSYVSKNISLNFSKFQFSFYKIQTMKKQFLLHKSQEGLEALCMKSMNRVIVVISHHKDVSYFHKYLS